ncbi:methylase involved in ubiquinone/menaquinone biosynthesis [Sphingopyxis fribergensis]|uniref:Methylase involved in ubiquinone/menaquinone biosynthesis n=1 Tax=Sphingopyxis fribergensis TaxID=1515612 RepID=A0A0A7PFP8_9SPHN|nr:class I SAM-dependent methyltransferase [Sphingopyxis fribergensis]AJA08830.1 methylase involved in ubiquinone/menaquinone biosynthesis [Sphingopyxis fribergensis]
MSDIPTVPTHDWNGDSGDRWAANLARLDLMLEDFGNAAIRAAHGQPGEHILDIGCGSGTSTFPLAEQVRPGGHVLGVDISGQLVEIARAAAPAGVPAEFRCADAATAPLPAGSFDLLFSRFGVMFFDDPVAAFTHMRHALKPGGRLAFVCWRGAQENDWVRLPMAAIRDIVEPVPADPTAPGPFAFGDRHRLADILAAAGFTAIDIAPFDTIISYGRGATREAAIDDALDMAFQVGPLARALADQPDDFREKAAVAVRAAFAKQPGETSVLIDGAAWIVTARN